MGSGISIVLGGIALAGAIGAAALVGPGDMTAGERGRSRLAVLWTSGDPEVAHKVCFMYTHNAKKQRWFDEVLLIVWGPSSRLLVADKELQAAVKAMMADGVQVQACVACANTYGVSDRLRELGIEVKGMGPPLTDLLKSDWKVLTF